MPSVVQARLLGGMLADVHCDQLQGGVGSHGLDDLRRSQTAFAQDGSLYCTRGQNPLEARRCEHDQGTGQTGGSLEDPQERKVRLTWCLPRLRPEYCRTGCQLQLSRHAI